MVTLFSVLKIKLQFEMVRTGIYNNNMVQQSTTVLKLVRERRQIMIAYTANHFILTNRCVTMIYEYLNTNNTFIFAAIYVITVIL